MLKIKENLDLEELGVFGFAKRQHDNINEGVEVVTGYRIDIIVYRDKEINVFTEKGISILYDLIQAGIVEKVEE